jgi:hypothetical protein
MCASIAHAGPAATLSRCLLTSLWNVFRAITDQGQWFFNPGNILIIEPFAASTRSVMRVIGYSKRQSKRNIWRIIKIAEHIKTDVRVRWPKYLY